MSRTAPDEIPQNMKAIQIRNFGEPWQTRTVDVPTPKPHQLLVRIKAGGFCHTDCMAHEGEFNSPLPYIGSHEPAGVVVRVGTEVSGFKEGDRVGCINFDSCCGKCPDCKAGLPIYCDSPLMKGISADGAWAEYMAADARFAVKLPDDMAFSTAACLMCAGLTIYGAISKANLPQGSSLGIVGIGGLGHIGTQIAKALKYKVVAIDVKQQALDLVKNHDLSPDLDLLTTQSSVEARQKIADAFGGPYPGLDATILATDAPEAFEFAASITRKHGKLILLGQPEKGITLSYANVIFRDIQLVGSLLGDASQAKELLDLVTEHKIEVKIKEWRLEQAEDMRKEYLAGQSAGKNVIVFP